jgi:hypothetical protein
MEKSIKKKLSQKEKKFLTFPVDEGQNWQNV